MLNVKKNNDCVFSCLKYIENKTLKDFISYISYLNIDSNTNDYDNDYDYDYDRHVNVSCNVSLNEKKNVVNTSGLNSGIYLFKINNSGKISIIKGIKKNNPCFSIC